MHFSMSRWFLKNNNCISKNWISNHLFYTVISYLYYMASKLRDDKHILRKSKFITICSRALTCIYCPELNVIVPLTYTCIFNVFKTYVAQRIPNTVFAFCFKRNCAITFCTCIFSQSFRNRLLVEQNYAFLKVY